MTAEDAVKLLLQRFPGIASASIPESDLFDLAPPYYAYGRFADQVQARAADDNFVATACEFVNELAESGDSMLDEAVHVGVLESLASDPGLARRITALLRAPAKAKLQVIEREMYGREPAP